MTEVVQTLSDREAKAVSRARDRLISADARYHSLLQRVSDVERERSESIDAMQDLIEMLLDGEPPSNLRFDEDLQALVIVEDEGTEGNGRRLVTTGTIEEEEDDDE